MKRSLAGLIFSLIWCAVAVVGYVIFAQPGDGLNEIGAFVAGAVAPIAFLWFILGYYQQSEEIGANTAALLEHFRPYVICYLQAEEHMIRVVLENVGYRPAQNIQLSFRPPLEEFADTRFSQAQVQGQAYLAPGQKIIVYLTTAMKVMKYEIGQQQEDEFLLKTECTATYTGLDDRKYEEYFPVEHRIVRYASYQPKSLPYVLKDIHDQLKSIAETMDKVEKKLPGIKT